MKTMQVEIAFLKNVCLNSLGLIRLMMNHPIITMIIKRTGKRAKMIIYNMKSLKYLDRVPV